MNRSANLDTLQTGDSDGYTIPYFQILRTFARNSLVRDLSFRTNFILQCISSLAWTLMNLAFFKIIFLNARSIGAGSGWGEYEFYIFLATVWIIGGVVQTFFMPNAQEFSELIRTGNLDFVMLKPIDSQFLVSFPKFNWPSIMNVFAGWGLIAFALVKLSTQAENPLVLAWYSIPLYVFFLGCGLCILYSILISLASLSVWFGRNQNVYLIYFYITQVYRYPSEIYRSGVWGWGLWAVFTFVVPVLIVANVPSRLLAHPLRPGWEPWEIGLSAFAILAAVGSLWLSRQIFQRSLLNYRSASS